MFRTRPRTSSTEVDGIELSELERVYAVAGEVGRGAMAVVYRARHRAAGHEVAIKVVRSRHLDDRDVLERLVRESQLVARLDHPSIVRHFETRRLRGGHLAIVMQFVDGRTLQAIAAEGRVRTPDVEAMLRQLGDALRHSHEAGVVHRDVKPANILVDQRTGRALLSDFGIAKALHGAHDATATGLAIGTPAFMAPEQFVGSAVDGRADQYALALVGWSLLAGHEPWEGTQLYELMYRQQHELLPSAASLRADVPPRLSFAIDIGLRKDPGARYRSMSAFLLQLASDEPTEETLRLSALAFAAPPTAPRRDAPSRRPTERVPQGDTVAFERPAPARDREDPPGEAGIEPRASGTRGAASPAHAPVTAERPSPATPALPVASPESSPVDGPVIGHRPALRLLLVGIVIGIVIGIAATLAAGRLLRTEEPPAVVPLVPTAP